MNFLIGSGASAPAIKTAAGIESDINKLIESGKEKEANLKSLQFIEEITKAHSTLLSAPTAELKEVSDGYCNFIACIDKVLFDRKNILLPRQCSIFTTNYDLFIEHAAGTLPTVNLNDGFDRSAGLNTEFSFASEKYFDRTYRAGIRHSHQAEIPTINLIKLHGSLSWQKQKEDVLFSNKPVQPLSAADRADASKVVSFLAQHFMILPNFRKFHTTLLDRIYFDLLRLFSKAMDQQNVTLIAFGFSFADEHILDITRRALRNPTAHLTIMSYDKASAADYCSKFSRQRNVTVISPDAATKIDFDRLNLILKAAASGSDNAG